VEYVGVSTVEHRSDKEHKIEKSKIHRSQIQQKIYLYHVYMYILVSVYVKQDIQTANSQKHKGINKPHKLMEDTSPDLNISVQQIDSMKTTTYNQLNNCHYRTFLLLQDSCQMLQKEEETDRVYSVLDLFRSPRLRNTTLLLIAIW